MTKLPAITKELTAFAAGDLVYGVDISDFTDHPTGSSFKAQYTNLQDEINKGLGVTPEMFGAAADGATDDSAEIQLAIDDGRVVYLTSDKTYLVDAELTVATGTTIRGNGGTLKTGAALAVTGGATKMFLVASDNDVTFEGIRFVGNGADPPLGPFDRYIDVAIARSLTVENCIFEEAKVAIFASVLTQSTIANNRFYNFTANQVYLRSACVGNTISGNVFNDNGAQNTNNHTIQIEANAGQTASTGNTIVGNSVQSCGTPCQLTGTQCFGNTVTGNTLIGTSGDRLSGLGMKMSNTGRNTVSNNTIIGPLYGINEAAEGGTVYTGNTIVGHYGMSLNDGATTSAGPSSIVGNVIIADEPGVHSGIASAGAAGTITLQSVATAANRSVASSIDDAYNFKIVTITGGTGSGQTRTITDYVGSTKVANIAPVWTTTPDATSTYDVAKTTGTCQAGSTSSTIKLSLTAADVDDTYNALRVKITGGTGTLGQFRRIADYTGSTQVADVEPNWTVTPDGTTTYEVVKTVDGISINTGGHTISGNVVKGFQRDGINGDVAAASNLKIMNNHISGIGRYAFFIADDENYVAANVITDGIQILRGAFVSGNDNVILDNEFMRNLGGSGSGTSRNFVIFDAGGTGNLVRASLPSRVQNLSEDTNVIETGGLAIETVTNGSPALSTEGSTMLNSAGGAITATLGSGTYAGQTKFIRMIDATTSSTVQVTLHVTTDPEIFTFDAVDEVLSLKWSGAEWVTDYASATV